VEAFPEEVDGRLKRLFADLGIEEVWRHQAQAMRAALGGADVLVATPTASGKTMCYTVPVLQSLLESGGAARSLFLFPTKALSQDQTAGLSRLVEGLGEDWQACTYDGDTPPSVRRAVRNRGHLVLTNPWMLHAGILPNHAKWSELFRDLRWIVIDEVHTLAGVFGSSVANVLRRLVRIARHYGSDPKFLLSSATLRDGVEHAERLIGRRPVLVDEDGSPAGTRHFAVYNPPLLDPVSGMRANALEETRRLAKIICGPKRQAIFFCGRRTAVDVLTRYLKEQAGEMGLRPEEVRGYRGGYLPDLRREIERGLRAGEVRVVVSTNALELGIDIGSLDCAVLVGYPGSQASFWQRAGRVGRRGNPSLVVQVAKSDPIDQYLVHHPEHLLGAPKERLALDPDNLVILSEQVKCAAFELPFTEDRVSASGVVDPGFGAAAHTGEILDYLTQESGFLHARDGRWYWMADAYPAADVSLEGGEPDNVLILDAETKKAVGEIDREGSLTTVHEGAIYQVEGESWIVERFDYANRRAYVRRVETDYFTEAETDTEVRILRLERKAARSRAVAPVEGAPIERAQGEGASTEGAGARADAVAGGESGLDHAVWQGEVHVTTVATQYKKIRFYSRENVGAEDIHLPAEELDTECFILTLGPGVAEDLGLTSGDRGAAWGGLGRLMRRVAPLLIRCEPSDLGISTQVRSPHFRAPAIYLYDRVQGGVGLGELLFQEHRPLFQAALEVLERCPCDGGCPGCVGPPEEVGSNGKELATHILAHLCRGPLLVEEEVVAEDVAE
jgi:DEAD/DEAH box helicase domain-containing protein